MVFTMMIKKMNFSVNYKYYDKLINILEHIDEELNINSCDFMFEKKAESTLKLKYLMKHVLKKSLNLL